MSGYLLIPGRARSRFLKGAFTACVRQVGKHERKDFCEAGTASSSQSIYCKYTAIGADIKDLFSPGGTRFGVFAVWFLELRLLLPGEKILVHFDFGKNSGIELEFLLDPLPGFYSQGGCPGRVSKKLNH